MASPQDLRSPEKATKTKKASGRKDFVHLDGMRFEKTPFGLVFCPEYSPHHRKHHCPDCMECAWCSDPRCAVCRKDDEATSKG
ncbi:MAG: hypothetical protein SWQ30_22980 [Thermodesulfobacteriota bacterium]|nr:hypothetical protein [Thermodesulfobacteriota bacterium]